ncbi:hypothetical protein OAF06_01565 [Akkermansiaceae bacterium]|nr:hypothetical protein [Akkermansiaceae bacterium]MDB4462097.1 hypothetical protein [bacterium]MDB4433661.1 hypothetical protein [Akkermansiaceae bacterium]MDB4546531.1 hypothetical protein [Akkermansiaceae bacterium]MDB4644202.1 hypothetical protein [bacterium]
MNLRNIKTSITALISLFLVTSNTYASSLKGIWINTDPDTRSISKIEITKEDTVYGLQLWEVFSGKSERRAPIELEVLGDSVDDPNPAKYGYAQKEFNWATKRYILRRKGDKLELEILTIFVPPSERPGPFMADDRVNSRSSAIFQLQEK